MNSSRLLTSLFVLLAATAYAATDFTIEEAAGKHLDVLRDNKVIARYMMAYDPSTPASLNETYKPYLHVFDEEGKAPITKGAGGDFTHHRGIFEGWMKIGVNGKTYDRWHMKGGSQVHQKTLYEQGNEKSGTFTSLVKWFGEGENVILEDERTFAVLPPNGPFYTSIDVTSKIKAVAGDTTLDGDPEHSGLQFRPAQEVDRSKTVYVYPKENANAHKDKDYAWFGETFSLNGKSYSVVYLNHPDNPKGTAISAYRDYGRFGAFFKTSIKKDDTLTLKVRFLIAQGEMPAVDVLQKAWNDFAGKTEPTPVVTVKPAEKPAPKKPKVEVKKETSPAAAKS